jgi:tagatose 1,6-diphosphate aldolase
MSTINLGKVRGLTQLSTSKGIFAILACDQRGAIEKMLKNVGKPGDYTHIVRIKEGIVGTLSPIASGTLLDPEYGVAPSIMNRSLVGKCGLVLAVDATGYTEEAGERITSILPGWSVEKIKRTGASAVKLLVYYNPNHQKAAEKQEQLIAEVAADCRKYDLPFMLEVLVYPTDKKADPKKYTEEKEFLVIESARKLSKHDIDLYKVEFPVDIKYCPDEKDWKKAFEKLTEVCSVPWALLSAGVDFDTYVKQVQIACQSGASGFVGGRAIWKEAVICENEQQRQEILSHIMPERMRILLKVAETSGRPWFAVPSHLKLLSEPIEEGWYHRY